MDTNAFLFSSAALDVLNNQQYDPTAKGAFEWLSGGLMWNDERPRCSQKSSDSAQTNEKAKALEVLPSLRG